MWTICRCLEYPGIPRILWQRGVGVTIHGYLELLWKSSKDKGCLIAILDYYVCLLCGGGYLMYPEQLVWENKLTRYKQ